MLSIKSYCLDIHNLRLSSVPSQVNNLMLICMVDAGCWTIKYEPNCASLLKGS